MYPELAAIKIQRQMHVQINLLPTVASIEHMQYFTK